MFVAVSLSINDSTASGRNFVLTVMGDLDSEAAGHLERHLRKQVPGDQTRLVVDLTHVQRVDDACAKLVARRSAEVASRGQQLRIIARQGPVLDTLDRAGLRDLVDLDRRAVVRSPDPASA